MRQQSATEAMAAKSIKSLAAYYSTTIESLQRIFGTSDVRVAPDHIWVEDKAYLVVDDVIILLPPSRYPASLRARLGGQGGAADAGSAFAPDIQLTFGEEWKKFSAMLPEYERVFYEYFDLVDVASLRDSRVCDLGCGMGRWSAFLADKCEELILVDFSEAIFVARRNLRHAPNALYFMADIKQLPFADNFCDFLFSLGVLHHLPTPALDEVRALKKYAPTLLIYLYYALDNRPFYMRALLRIVTMARSRLCKINNATFRSAFTWLTALVIYKPLALFGSALRPLGLSRYVPLYEAYTDRSVAQMRQDVYDRFFTRIEQRVSRAEIMKLTDTFSDVTVSLGVPYWHFVCRR